MTCKTCGAEIELAFYNSYCSRACADNFTFKSLHETPVGEMTAVEVKRFCDLMGDEKQVNEYFNWLEKNHAVFHRLMTTARGAAQADSKGNHVERVALINLLKLWDSLNDSLNAHISSMTFISR